MPADTTARKVSNLGPMFAVLALLFLVVPFVELFLLIQVGQAVGAVPTILGLIVVSVVGAWLVKREGIAVLRRAQEQVRNGHVPGQELVDGVLILFAGPLPGRALRRAVPAHSGGPSRACGPDPSWA